MPSSRIVRRGALIAAIVVVAIGIALFFVGSPSPEPSASGVTRSRATRSPVGRLESWLGATSVPNSASRIEGSLLGGAAGVRVALVARAGLSTAARIGKTCECEDCPDAALVQACAYAIPRLAALVELIEAEGGPVDRLATADERGAFLFDVLSPGTYVLWAGEAGELGIVDDVKLSEGETKHVDVRPTDAGAISGVVKDESGDPLENAEVIALDVDLGTIRKVRSGQDGRFEIDALDGARRYYIQAAFGDRAPDGRLPVRTKEEVELVLARSASIRGLVLDQRRPVAGATIETDLDDRKLKSDGQGRFTIDRLKPESLTLFVETEKHRGATQSLTLAAGEVRDVVIEVEPLCKLEVHVLDVEGRPAQDQYVVVLKSGDDESDELGFASTNESGVAVVDFLPRERAISRVEEEGGEAEVEVPPCGENGRSIVWLTMKAAPGVVGVVRDEKKRPIADADVHIWLPRDDGRSERIVSTDRRGMYRFAKVGEGTWRVEAFKEGFIRARQTIARTDASPDTNLDLVLMRGGKIQGRVADEANRPLRGWFVSARIPANDATDEDDEEESSFFDRSISTESKKDGTFVLRGLEPDRTYIVEASFHETAAHGQAPDFRTTNAVRAKTGDKDIALTAEPAKKARRPRPQWGAPPSKDARIAGQVIDGDTKAPIVGAKVKLRGRRPAMLEPETTASSSGEFVFEHLESGDYSVRVQAEGYAVGGGQAIAEDASADSEPMIVALHRGCEIAGRIAIIGGSAAQIRFLAVPFEWTPGDGMFEGGHADLDGSFRHRLPRSGRYRFSVFVAFSGWRFGDPELEYVSVLDVPDTGLEGIAIEVPLGVASLSIVVRARPAGVDAAFRDQNVLLAFGSTVPARARRAGDLPPGLYFVARGSFEGQTLRFDHLAPGDYRLYVDPFFSTDLGPPPTERAIMVPASGEVSIGL
jgi:hypothetical protein